ncbi:oligosaccharide flippase family protein [Pseudomonas sp. MUP55]|uniref:oligosaccharide flippase family protein n=1 Tax=Pseudomonas sp. MUP55 TaxID=3087234 RepID=UPI002A5A1D3D|nr:MULTISPECIES: oligosaccharide flippase family protein [unclassified Pseudomonas]WPN94326.1 oligosaccharide flippase family protein [Pseudomonas sp. MUP56]WPN99853.1 oligosaccharide flippase family protein [Pseudomonas sp. MUP55]
MIKSIINIGSQALAKLMFSIVSLKVIAYYAGPSGMAALGQLQAFLQIASAGASSVTSTGVVKLVSEGKVRQEKVIACSFFLLLVYSAILFLVFSAFVDVISDFFFGKQWRYALLTLPLAAFFLGVNSLFVSYYNGVQNYRLYFLYSISLSFLTSITTIVITVYFHLEGAIYSVVFAPVIAGGALLFFFRGWGRIKSSSNLEDFKPIAKTLLQFSLMALVSAVVVYGGQIYLRYFISDNVSVSASGLWYSATRLSDIYIGIASVLFSTILLPRYSSINGEDLTFEVWKVFKVAIAFAFLMVVCVRLLSGIVVGLIYGADFSAAANVLDLYVIGDALKVLTWVFLYVFIAKQKVLFYLVYEVITALMYVGFSIMAFRYFEFSNMALGYIVQSAFSLGVLLCWFLKFSDKLTPHAETTNV